MSYKITVNIQMTVDDNQIIDNLQESVESCFEYFKQLPKKSFSYSFKSEEVPVKLSEILL
jgi:hypothetical protein